MQNQNVKTIDSEIGCRLTAGGFRLEIESHPFTGGNWTRFYRINGKKCLVFNYKDSDEKIIGNPVIATTVLNDPKRAIDAGGRQGAGTFGKKLILKNIGTENKEQYDYIAMLLSQLFNKENDSITEKIKSPVSLNHFEELRDRINRLLKKLAKESRIPSQVADLQINKYQWLYGALGEVPSRVMFICENPSIKGVKKANINTVDGNAPDIEAQWWGNPKDNAAKRFRKALCELGLKTSAWNEKGGWKCYITNVIKQANVVKDQNALESCIKEQQARDWADILQWEIKKVEPRYIFCVGDKTKRAIELLQKENLLQKFTVHKIMHYSARDSDGVVIKAIMDGIKSVIA